MLKGHYARRSGYIINTLYTICLHRGHCASPVYVVLRAVMIITSETCTQRTVARDQNNCPLRAGGFQRFKSQTNQHTPLFDEKRKSCTCIHTLLFIYLHSIDRHEKYIPYRLALVIDNILIIIIVVISLTVTISQKISIRWSFLIYPNRYSKWTGAATPLRGVYVHMYVK